MAELRESSLLFSLEGLLETERERVNREAREAQNRRDDEMLRVAELASRRRLAQEQEREARERRQALERERERLEDERIDAMKQATVERARIETEGKMRLVEVEQRRKHELLLVQLREGQLTARYRTLAWLGSAAFALSLTGATGSYFAFIQPARARAEQQLQATISRHVEQSDKTERALTAERAENQRLGEQIRQLAAEPVANATPESKPQSDPTRPHPGVPTKGYVPPARPRGPCKDTGDPLDKCLK